MQGKNFGKLFAGEVHYSRIPFEYWQHRIQMIKALGLNTLSVYIMWNYHEVEKGKYDFETGNKNLPFFLELAQKHKMKVLFRPGPYVCAEWDFGGLPARLLNVQGLVIREDNEKFFEETEIYFKALVPIMKKHMKTNDNPNGCIVMLQIENEYGFYGEDKNYMEGIRKLWKKLEISCPEYYVDWPANIKKCHWEGAHIGINNFLTQQNYEQVRQFQKNGYILGGQMYSGWMTHWTEKWGGKKIEKVLAQYEFLLSNGHSFAMYMVHGGTNFGLTAGANGLKDKVNDYWGAITSYDYDAPINEQGSATEKYMKLRELIKKYVDWQVPQIPKPINMISIQQIKVKEISSLFKNLPEEYVTSDKPLFFQSNQLQMYNQGMVLYETQIDKINYNFKVIVHDYGVVYLGNKLISILDRTSRTQHNLDISVQMIEENGNTLRILVQASGHINFDKCMKQDQKGLWSIENYEKGSLKWKMYKVPVDNKILEWKGTEEGEFPKVYEGQFEIEEVGDVYLDMSNYGKGYIWMNGNNLGRYWIQGGPQTRYFCPGAWLRKGGNRLQILNICGKGGKSIRGVRQLYENPIVYDE